jgi:antibiotic biosynthesis monooxygenase (ABM) superfamily enzyme
MRLLNTKTPEFHEVYDIPREYAIASHTRRIKAEEEVTYEEWKDRGSAAIQAKPGYRKIVDFCRKARRDGFKLVWVDTCCINKKALPN